MICHCIEGVFIVGLKLTKQKQFSTMHLFFITDEYNRLNDFLVCIVLMKKKTKKKIKKFKF